MKKVLMTLWLSGVLNYTLGQINSVYPDSGRPGEPLELNIISNNFFPPGIYLVILKQGSYQFDLSNNAYPYYPDSLRATGFIPFEAPPGVYDILVTDTATMNTYSLPASFTIPAPDGYANGEVYFDENLNGIRDIGEDGIANQMIECHSLMHAFFTDSNGFFHIPLYNGFYMVRHLYTYNHMYRVTSDTAMYNIQINNSDVNGLSFGLADMLHNTSPPISGFSTVSLTVESHFPFSFSTDPWGYISDARLIATPPDTFILIIPLSNITLISPYLIHMYFTIPVGQQTGVYDLRISTGAAFFQRKAFIITHSPSYLTGNVFFDGNSNGIRDIGEFPSQNKMLFLSPDSSYAFSNINGDYSFATPAGLHELSFASGDVVVTSVPVTYNFTNSSDSSGLDFGVRYTTADYTSDINLMPGFPRCNQNVTGTITYKNSSNVVSQGTIWMILSSNLIFVTSNPSIVSQNGDTLFWNFVHLQPGESRSITFTTTLPGVGLTISYYCNMIVTDALGNVMYTTADDGGGTVTCSYNPNDKACDPPGVNDIMHYTLLNDTLEYLIRFQNSGTDTAFNIFIRDTSMPRWIFRLSSFWM